jgi:hypothetical protein
MITVYLVLVPSDLQDGDGIPHHWFEFGFFTDVKEARERAGDVHGKVFTLTETA